MFDVIIQARAILPGVSPMPSWRKPLIVTTNLTLEELQNPEDTAHARIYARLMEMCTPVRITGENFRKARAREKMEQLKTLLNGKESL